MYRRLQDCGSFAAFVSRKRCFTFPSTKKPTRVTAWRSWLAAQPEIDAEAVLGAAERVLRALWRALDAVYPEGCAKN